MKTVTLGLQVLRKIYMGDAQITVSRMKEVFGTAFTENEYILKTIERDGLSDDSMVPVQLLSIMFECGNLILPSKPTYREIAQNHQAGSTNILPLKI